MKPKLSKAAVQLREQIDDQFSERDRASDGWIADQRHMRTGKSDHIPDAQGWVRALDVSVKLGSDGQMWDVANQLRIAAKRGDKRISYIIFDGKICSRILRWKWRRYRGFNPHKLHCHISFTKKGDKDGKFFNVPLLGGSYD